MNINCIRNIILITLIIYLYNIGITLLYFIIIIINENLIEYFVFSDFLSDNKNVIEIFIKLFSKLTL